MTVKIDYDHLYNQIMGSVHTITESGEDTAEQYAELIDFLENMYVNALLSLIGTLLTVAKHSDHSETMERSLLAVRELMNTPADNINEKVQHKYRTMIKAMNLPDAYQEKSNNEKVSEEIKAEIASTGT